MKRLSFIGALVLMGATLTCRAQENQPALTPELNHITLHQSPSLSLLLDEHRDFMHQLATLPGYRIQLYTTTRLKEANVFRMSFEQVFPDIKVYILFNEPNYRIRVGNFTDRITARAQLEALRETYPTAIVVKDQINLEAL